MSESLEKSLKNRVAPITGAGRPEGIGFATAKISAPGVGSGELYYGPAPAAWNQYVPAPIFILLGIAQAGVRVGRETDLVDAAPECDSSRRGLRCADAIR